MKRFRFSIQLITDEIEIDLYECMKYDQIRNNGHIRAYLPPPYHAHVYLPLTRTRQRLGWRMWFLAPCCGRRTSKLYAWGRAIACRHCVSLKYASQYKKNNLARRREMCELKLKRLDKQKRKLWYDDKPTQFGRQFYKLRAEQEQLSNDILSELRMKVAMLPTFERA